MTPPPESIEERLPALLSASAEDATAAITLTKADAALPKATRTEDIVGLKLVRANALGILGRDKESCDVVQSIKMTGASTKYAPAIERLLKSC